MEAHSLLAAVVFLVWGAQDEARGLPVPEAAETSQLDGDERSLTKYLSTTFIPARNARGFLYYGRRGMSAKAQEEAKNAEMIAHVKMLCLDCGGEVDYVVECSCPCCGMINIRCSKCGWDYSFGE